MAQTRQRTKGQRTPKKEDLDEGPVLDEQEQEDEIEKLRTANEASTKHADTSFDLGIIIASAFHIMDLMRFLRDDQLAATGLCVAQLVMLPLSLSHKWLPAPIYDFAATYHTYIVCVQLVALAFLVDVTWADEPTWAEILRFALPSINAIFVEVQHRSAVAAEEALKRLEKKKYNVKGA
ncbi:hypothetical protein BD324DRAFT_648854 [Kockovaella imperatae]|uniref:Uncharacterized protein n=1 Tax=Kockovaella imperatae TaxID=4999 RepID=A0A1Y1UST7_9TREE|nr:hypothetical protein BD324DRAFT_648854 [Kockovaella imperatae]ORX40265.1 hypothetical protein BD324DRAFT_648854 [Kockovaella imperatae]